MTGILTLKMERDHNAELAAGAVVTLQRVWMSEAVKIDSQRINLSITPEQGISGRDIDVEPGRWLIEATLGAGDLVSEIADISDGESVTVVIPLADKSPHEWLGWQFNNGNVEGREAFQAVVEQAKILARQADEKYRIVVRARMLSRSMQSKAKKGAASIARGLNSLRSQFDPDGTVSGVILSVQNELNKRAAVVRIIQQRDDNEGTSPEGRWDVLTSNSNEDGNILAPFKTSPEDRLYLYRPGSERAGALRRFLDVGWESQRYRVAIPEPWLSISNSTEVGAELLVRKHPLDKNLKASLAVLDPDFSTIAAMMMTPAMPKATVFVEDNAKLMFSDNSIAGAAAAYVVLSSGRIDGDLLALVRNFEVKSAVPDALVIAAWRMIRFPEAGQPPVRPNIIRAFEAGPPFLSIGVGWLLDALTILGPDDAEAVKYAEIVKRVAIRIDTTQVFTTVRQGIP